MTLGERIRKAREMAEFSLRDVEEKTGISYSYLSNLENDRRKSPSMKTLNALASLYGVDISYFLTDDPTSQPGLKEEERLVREFLNDKDKLLLLREVNKLSPEELSLLIRIVRAISEEAED